jgi:hypothetical protein
MTANEMFNKLGYEQYNCGEIEHYDKYLDLGWVRIMFDKENLTLYIVYDSWFALYEQTIEQMEPEERKAIRQRLKELGWHFRKRKYVFVD